MAYIGHKPAEKYVSLTTQHFTVTATASYVLTNSVTNENEIALFINNVRQEPGGSYAYTAAGTTLTLSAATAGTDTMYCVYLGKAVGTIAPPDGSVNSAKIVDGSITDGDLAGSISSAKITSLDATKLTGTVDNARISLDAAEIPDLDASKITTGDIALARLGNAPATDLTPVRQDIAMLALYNAISDNRAAYNLPFSFIDQFEDDTGTTTRTDVSNVSEYFATVYSDTVSTVYRGNYSFTTSPAAQTFSSVPFGTAASNRHVVVVAATGTALATPSGVTAGGVSGTLVVRVDGGDAMDIDIWIVAVPTGTSGDVVVTQGTASSAGGMAVYTMTGANATAFHTNTVSVSGSGGADISSTINVAAGGGVIAGIHGNHSTMPTWAWTVGLTEDVDFQTVSVYSMSAAHDDFAAAETGRTVTIDPSTVSNAGFALASFQGGTAANATGTLISDTQTSSVATTKMSGVILYKDNAGTATLGTDLVISLSANGGSNYTEAASYGAVTPLFSTGVKMVRLGETTVTSGTAPVIKAVWANQASGSKETQLHGWAMNY